MFTIAENSIEHITQIINIYISKLSAFPVLLVLFVHQLWRAVNRVGYIYNIHILIDYKLKKELLNYKQKIMSKKGKSPQVQ